MDLKNKYLVTSVRVFFSLFLLMAAIAGFFGAKAIVNGNPMEGISAQDIELTKAFWDTGIIQLAKAMELVVAVMLITNFLPALAVIFITPITIGIIVYHLFSGPQNLPISIAMGLVNVYLIYIYFDKYKALFDRNIKIKSKLKKSK